MITGLRRPILSEINPSKGQPMIHPSGTVAERITAEAYVESVCLLQVAHTPDHVEDGCGDKKKTCNQAAQDRLRVFEYRT